MISMQLSKKDKIMCSLEKAYRRFWQELQTSSGEETFHSICRKAHACPSDLSALLRHELGTDPDYLIVRRRRDSGSR